jgi:hypothetical protein
VPGYRGHRHEAGGYHIRLAARRIKAPHSPLAKMKALPIAGRAFWITQSYPFGRSINSRVLPSRSSR